MRRESLAFVIAVLLSSAAAKADDHVFAVIVASNSSFDGSRAPLRYADDDAARYFELFALSTRDVALLTVMDADTQRVYAPLVGATRPPDHATLERTLTQTFDSIKAARAAGERTVFYFVYSGHGDVKADGEGYVHLLDGPFTRHALFDEVIAASPADVNHVIVDACNAYFMVASRGGARPAGDYAELVKTLVSRESLEAHPNTGVVLATTAAAEVHEWNKVEAGVFSHELRSAMAGAADVNGDGAVDYTEIAAFLAAANSGVVDAKARVQALTRAPRQNLNEPLAKLPAKAPSLTVPEAWSGRYTFEDDRKVRVADTNKAVGQRLTLKLAPRPGYTVTSAETEYRTGPLSDGQAIVLDPATMQTATIAARGDDPLERTLFVFPFDAEYVSGFAHAQQMAPDPLLVSASVAPPKTSDNVRIGALAVGGVGLTAALVLKIIANATASKFRDAAGSVDHVHDLRARAQSENDAALTLGVVGAAGLVTAGGITLYDWLR